MRQSTARIRKLKAMATAHTSVAGSCNQRCNDDDEMMIMMVMVIMMMMIVCVCARYPPQNARGAAILPEIFHTESLEPALRLSLPKHLPHASSHAFATGVLRSKATNHHCLQERHADKVKRSKKRPTEFKTMTRMTSEVLSGGGSKIYFS